MVVFAVVYFVAGIVALVVCGGTCGYIAASKGVDVDDWQRCINSIPGIFGNQLIDTIMGFLAWPIYILHIVEYFRKFIKERV